MEAAHRAVTVSLTLCAVVLLISSGQSGANQTIPVNYAQCVKATKKAVGNPTATEIAHACRKEFPKKRPQDEDLTPEALGKLDAHGGFGYGIFGGSIYNGNSDYTITQVTLLLTPIPAESPLITSEYNIDVIVQPLSKGELAVALTSDVTREFSWSLIKIRGYKTH